MAFIDAETKCRLEEAEPAPNVAHHDEVYAFQAVKVSGPETAVKWTVYPLTAAGPRASKCVGFAAVWVLKREQGSCPMSHSTSQT